MPRLSQKQAAPAIITATLDTAADSEGYYQVILGEQLDGGRYQVFSSLGKGMFANVVRARVLQADASEVGEVAIKIVRCQESMYVLASFPIHTVPHHLSVHSGTRRASRRRKY